MADTTLSYFIPRFFNDQMDDPLVFDSDLGLLSVINNVPPGFLTTTQISDAINRCCGVDGVNRPRPGHDLFSSIPNCTYVNNICHLNQNTFLMAATVGGNAQWYSLVNTGTNNVSTGGPSFTVGTNPNMVQGLNAIYVTTGGSLWKWNGTTWTQISIGNSVLTGSPALLSNVTYFTNRVIVSEAGSNVLYFSNFLSDGGWNTTNLMVQLDQFTKDSIVGMYPFQNFQLAVFKNSSTWLVDCNPDNVITTPTVSMANTPITKVSDTIGCCNPRTIAEIYNDVIFLSEGGRGVYSVGQIATNEQLAVKTPLSLPIKSYINRINWNAIGTAFATAWDDLYLLHVPLDGATSPNYVLVYCASLGTWQGLWTGFNGTCATRQDTGSPTVRYIWCDISGNIYQQWHQEDGVYVDTVNGNILTGTPFQSSVTSRGYRFDQAQNLIQPFNVIYEFTGSLAPVSSQLYADGQQVGLSETVATMAPGLNLPFNLPFNLVGQVTVKQCASARQCGICSELICQLTGTGTWHLTKIAPSCFVSRGQVST